jgi:uncharacterized protein YndB with AHSA1/START domain
MAAKNKPNELYIERIYDAPVKVVWDAWTDPEKKKNWWGPRGFTITTHESDIRTGGVWHYTMHGPDKEDYVNKTKYLEVEKYSRMVYDHGGNDERKPLFRVTVEFKEVNGKTKMEMVMALPTADAATETKKFIKQKGGDSTWDRLAEHLSDKDRFIINRTFETSIDTMYDMWTDTKHFAHWMGPTGSALTFVRADVKVGGTSFYKMEMGAMVMYGLVEYKELNRPNKIVYTQQFVDQNEKLSRHPMSPTWPATMLTSVTLTEEEKNRTRVTLQWEVHGEATAVERETFHSAKAGMAQGWGGSFEKLEEYLMVNIQK